VRVGVASVDDSDGRAPLSGTTVMAAWARVNGQLLGPSNLAGGKASSGHARVVDFERISSSTGRR
jgi:hypothetical protein